MPSSVRTVGNVGGKVILSTSASGTTYSKPQMVEARGFKNWTFCLSGTFTGMSATIYGTVDPAALNPDGSANQSYPAPGATGGNWFALNSGPQATSPADVQNPLTAVGQYLPFASCPLVAVCAVNVGTTPTGTVNVLAFASE